PEGVQTRRYSAATTSPAPPSSAGVCVRCATRTRRSSMRTTTASRSGRPNTERGPPHSPAGARFRAQGDRAASSVREWTTSLRAASAEPFTGGLHRRRDGGWREGLALRRSEEHTSELQSRENLVCRLLLE